MKIAAFGFRNLPPAEGGGGEDKFAYELYPRLVAKGHSVTAYTRIYSGKKVNEESYAGVRVIKLRTINKSGFDTLLHSFRATCHIIMNNTAEIIHIHNGGNSIWAIFLRIFGKKVIISQDGIDWKREKWNLYAKLFLYISSYLTAKLPNKVIFDNIYSKELFEKKYGKNFNFIPYGCEVNIMETKTDIFLQLGIEPNEYFLFVGRFIPDKGLHYLIPAFEQTNTKKKLVLVGGTPNPSEYAINIKNTNDKRILFPGYIYGDNVNSLIKNAYCYIQPSDIEGLSPVILSVMYLETPLICSNIKENLYIVENNAIIFERGNISDLKQKLEFSLNNPTILRQNALNGKLDVKKKYNWNKIVDQHIQIFSSP